MNAKSLKAIVKRIDWRWERSFGRSDLEQMIRKGRANVGVGTYGKPRIFEYGFDETRLWVGNYSSIARDVVLVLGGNHRIDTVSTFPLAIRLGLASAGTDGQPWSKGDIEIGSDVWIGTGATILSGVHVGDGAVVAAGALVTNDIRSFAVVAGNPAKEIRRRFSDSQCEALSRVAWWNWDERDVRRYASALASSDVEGFLNQHDKSQPA